jgi:hypothetical protein
MRAQLNERAHKIIIEALASNATLGEAAAKAGVHRATLWEWLTRGADEEEGPYADLYMDAELARYDFHHKWLGYIEAGANGTNPDAKPGAAQWVLERRRKDIYGVNAKTEALPERTKTAVPISKAKGVAAAARLRLAPGGGGK